MVWFGVVDLGAYTARCLSVVNTWWWIWECSEWKDGVRCCRLREYRSVCTQYLVPYTYNNTLHHYTVHDVDSGNLRQCVHNTLYRTLITILYTIILYTRCRLREYSSVFTQYFVPYTFNNTLHHYTVHDVDSGSIVQCLHNTLYIILITILYTIILYMCRLK